jgi:predicted ATPase/DNA-binding CsgD family transcriptional regulator
VTQVVGREAGGLPREVTSFVGRRQALTQVKKLLSASRLVTLTGVGGVGKSRLARHAARDLQRAFPDGVWLVELAELRDASLVAHAVAATLGLRDQSMREPETVLCNYLANKRLLLLLDNCEHLLDACGQLVTRLLSAAPRLRILATSREPLGIMAEHRWQVPPLPVAHPARSGAHQEALTLFEDRAAAVSPDFTINPDNVGSVTQLCQRLDGLPLALELASVHLRTMSLQEILTRLEHRFALLTSGSRTGPPRHRTLEAAIGWSFDLCSKAERTLWSRCSVFAGEFDLEAAAGVCTDDDVPPEDVLQQVTGLVDKSVLIREQRGALTRFRMLETIREYGAEHLARAGEDGVLRRRHRDYYLRLAEEADTETCGPQHVELLERLRIERPNLWTALDYSLQNPSDSKIALRMGSALWLYWLMCGFMPAGRYWLDRALAQDTEPSPERLRALWVDGFIAFLQGDSEHSLQRLTECRDLAQQLGDERMQTYALQYLGAAEMWANNLEAAIPMLDEALARHRAANHWTSAALVAFAQQAQITGLLGDLAGAEALRDECRAHCERLGERWAMSWMEWHLAVNQWAAGNPQKTASHLEECLRLKRDMHDELGVPFCVEMLAWVADSDGEAHRSAVLFGAAGHLWELLGRPLMDFKPLVVWSAQSKERTREALGRPAFEAAMREGARMSPWDIVAYALREKESAAAEVPAPALASPAQQLLTNRERQVAALVAEGMPNKEIAARLVISQRTAESHVENILNKLGFTSRTQIAVWVAEAQ